MSKKKTDSKHDSGRMPTREFIPLYLEAVETGMTREAFAKKIGVLTETVYQRIYDMHQRGADPKDFPQLPTEGRRPFADKVRESVAQYRKTKKKGVVTGTPATGSDGDLDPTAELERMLGG